MLSDIRISIRASLSGNWKNKNADYSVVFHGLTRKIRKEKITVKHII